MIFLGSKVYKHKIVIGTFLGVKFLKNFYCKVGDETYYFIEKCMFKKIDFKTLMED